MLISKEESRLKKKGTMDLQNIHKTALTMTILSTYLLINRINYSNKRHSMVEWMNDRARSNDMLPIRDSL